MLQIDYTTRSADLHLHSTCSDGLSTPEELVSLARNAGLRTISLCDHDTVSGIDAARAAGDQLGVEVIPGVELSSMWQTFQDVHLLGYGIDHRHARLSSELAAFRAFRLQRNRQILDRINERLRRDRRPTLDFHDIMAETGETVGRPHLARELLRRGYVRSMEEAFQLYLIPCNVPKRFFPLDEAIRLVHQSGGAAVLAHPLLINPDHDRLARLFDELCPLGLDGIEVYTPLASCADIRFFTDQARRRGLVITGGSDFHGDAGRILPCGTETGFPCVPPACVEGLKAAIGARSAATPAA